MKRVLGLILVLVMLLSFAAIAEEEEPALLEHDLVILYTSDVHCGVDKGFGYAGLAAIKQQLIDAGTYVLLVDDGDNIQGEPIGTVTRGEALTDLMNVVGYDVAIPGNHEFDYGMDRFLELAEKADFPYISCNFNKEGELVFDPYVIFEVDNLKLAFVGVTTPVTLRSSTPKYFQDENGEFIYGFCQDDTGEGVYNAVQSAVDAARAEGADIVVLMGHMGNEAECKPWTYADVLANTTGIDIMLDGHSHDTDQVVMQNKDGEDVIRGGCGTKLEGIGHVMITTDGKIEAGLWSWNNDVSVPDLLAVYNKAGEAIAAKKKELDELLMEVVAKTSVDLCINDPTATTPEGKPVRIIRNAETNLGDLVSDAYLDQSGADVAFVNGGGIRAQLPAGNLTIGQILTVHPFGNSLTVVEATGQQILDCLEWSTHSVPGEFGGFMHVSGITYELHTYLESTCTSNAEGMFTGVAGEYRVKNVMINGEPLDLEKTYTVASHDYMLLNNGDGYTMFDGCNVLQESVKLDYQVVVDYITGTLGGVVADGYDDPYGQGRLVVVEEAPEA